MPKRVWAAPPWPARVPLPSDDDDTARVVAAAGGARGVTHALVSMGDERVIEVAGLLESTSDDHRKTPSGGAA